MPNVYQVEVPVGATAAQVAAALRSEADKVSPPIVAPPPPPPPPPPGSASSTLPNPYAPPGMTRQFRDYMVQPPSARWSPITPLLYNNDPRMSAGNVRSENGVAIIGARMSADGKTMTTGGFTSRGKWTPRGGTGALFVRARTLGVDGKAGMLGGHTGLWFYSSDNSGRENDMLEVLTRDKRARNTYHGERNGGQNVNNDPGVTLPFDTAADFHIFGCRWTPDLVRYTCDDIETFKIAGSGVGTRWGFGTQAFDVLLQTFIGEPDINTPSWLGQPIDKALMSRATAAIDWVEWYTL